MNLEVMMARETPFMKVMRSNLKHEHLAIH